jgi:hypothetical protein
VPDPAGPAAARNGRLARKIGLLRKIGAVLGYQGFRGSRIFRDLFVLAGAGGSGVRRDRRERDVTAEGAGQPRSPADRPQSLTAASIVSRLAGRLFPHLACGPDAGSKPRPGIPEHGNGFRHRRCRLGFVHTPSLADERDTCEPDAAALAQVSHIRAYKGTGRNSGRKGGAKIARASFVTTSARPLGPAVLKRCSSAVEHATCLHSRPVFLPAGFCIILLVQNPG